MNSGDPIRHTLIRRACGGRDFGKSDFTNKMFAINWLKESIYMIVDLGKSGDILNDVFTIFYLAQAGVTYVEICSIFALQTCLQTFAGLLQFVHLVTPTLRFSRDSDHTSFDSSGKHLPLLQIC